MKKARWIGWVALAGIAALAAIRGSFSNDAGTRVPLPELHRATAEGPAVAESATPEELRAEAVGRTDFDATEGVSRYLDDPSEAVRRAAVESLARAIRNRPAAFELLRNLFSREASTGVRTHIIDLIRWNWGPEAQERLVELREVAGDLRSYVDRALAEDEQ